MIRVNLLPPEYRKAEATPVKQFLSTIGAVVLAALAVVSWLWVRWRELDPTKQERDAIVAQVEQQKPLLQNLADLETVARDYKKRYDDIEKIAQNRLVLSQKLDELWEVIDRPKTPGRYDIWLRSLTMQVQPGKSTGGATRFSAYSAGALSARWIDFHEDLEQSDFFRDYDYIDPPNGTKMNLSSDREPVEGWEFSWQMRLKPLPQLYLDRAKAREGQGDANKK